MNNKVYFIFMWNSVAIFMQLSLKAFCKVNKQFVIIIAESV